jgi:hypothetical protein
MTGYRTTTAAESILKDESDKLGEAFARALAAKDRDLIADLLSDEVDFQALTPRRHWVAATSAAAVDEVILRHWLKTDDIVLGLRSMTSGTVGDRQRVGYRLAVCRNGTEHVLEQQAYYVTDGQRISWIRILCSGYRPADTELVPNPEPRNHQKEMHQA